jgi:hypothetical protein
MARDSSRVARHCCDVDHILSEFVVHRIRYTVGVVLPPPWWAVLLQPSGAITHKAERQGDALRAAFLTEHAEAGRLPDSPPRTYARLNGENGKQSKSPRAEIPSLQQPPGKEHTCQQVTNVRYRTYELRRIRIFLGCCPEPQSLLVIYVCRTVVLLRPWDLSWPGFSHRGGAPHQARTDDVCARILMMSVRG